MSRPVAALLLVLTVLSVFAVAPGAPVPRDRLRTLYFPTSVGTKWVYQEGQMEFTHVITAVEKAGDTTTVEVGWENGGQVVPCQTVAVSEQGLTFSELEPGGAKLDPPVCVLRLPAKDGEEWVHPARAGAGNTLTLKTRWTELVTVPAGLIRAVRVEKVFRAGGAAQTGAWYFAPDVGLVKEMYDRGRRPRVLKSFEPAKP